MAACGKTFSTRCGGRLFDFSSGGRSCHLIRNHLKRNILNKSISSCNLDFSLKCTNKLRDVAGLPETTTTLSNPLVSSRRYFKNDRNQMKVEDAAPKLDSVKETITSGPSFEHFLSNITDGAVGRGLESAENVPYLRKHQCNGRGRKVYFETYGCQMNVNDTNIAWSILKQSHFQRTSNLVDADVILLMTCSIREGAEKKIWNRLKSLKSLKKRSNRRDETIPLKIGILGCMAERLKADILEREHLVDVVCGPDAYKDLPRLLAVTSSGQAAINVQLSLDETYADVMPVRMNEGSSSAFVSIMRGCDNMCTYCIVPFTRGRERSRPISSILEEIRYLSDQGVKEVTLLGQNVNSYRDMSEDTHHGATHTERRPGFKTVYKPKEGGRRFSDLLDKVSRVDSEMRIRFTSPHPKDFPNEVLHLIKDRPNICKQLHVPAQSGNNETLEVMRRGYTRETYLDLITDIRTILPDVALTSDFIAGFCGETESAHQDTLTLMKKVQYNFAFCFPYSMREKTRASHRLVDDVADDVKARRHLELVDEFRQGAEKLNQALIGKQQLVLIEGNSRKSFKDLAGRNDANTKVILPKTEVPWVGTTDTHHTLKPGDYVVVQIISGSSQTLKGIALYQTTLQGFHSQQSQDGWYNIDQFPTHLEDYLLPL